MPICTRSRADLHEIGSLSLIEEDMINNEIEMINAQIGGGNVILTILIEGTQVSCTIDISGPTPGPLQNVVDANGDPIETGSFSDFTTLKNYLAT